MASMIVTMITMVVISLIVLGFATVSRREQRETLDHQLSAQAFYAAESGVEDARKVIQTALSNGKALVNKDDCLTNNPGGSYPTGISTVLDGFNEVSYTCLKVDAAPQNAKYDGVGDDYIVVPIKTSLPITSLDITWQPDTPPTGTPAVCPATTSGVFSPQDQWACGYGILRTDIVPTAGSLTTATLQSGMLTGFFVPTKVGASGQVSYQAGAGKPNIVAANCGTAAYTSCTASVTNLGGNTDFTLRISSLYRTSNMTITAYQGSTPLTIDGAQAIIDATGKAQDVLRRIQVRMPINAATRGTAPAYAMQSNASICKRFQVSRTYLNIPGDIVNKDDSNPLCVGLTSGVPPAPSKCPNGGMDIVLTLDTTGSLDEHWQTGKAVVALRKAANNFVQTVGVRPDGHHVSLVGFSESASRLYVSYSDDPNELTSYINGINPDNSTRYMLGLNLTDIELNKKPPITRPEVKKVVIFESDGHPDDVPRSMIRDKMAEILATGVTVYTIGVNGTTYSPDPVKPLEEDILRGFAGNGGRYARADSERQLQDIMQSIINDLRCDK